MIFTISNIAASIASYLHDYLPDVTFYENPNQQLSDMPCMFIQQRGPARIENKTSDRYLRTIPLDLTYLEDYNLTDLQERYQSVAEVLDGVMETFPYVSDDEDALIRTYNREWTVDLDALHYKFEIRVWVYPNITKVPMMDYDLVEVIRVN